MPDYDVFDPWRAFCIFDDGCHKLYSSPMSCFDDNLDVIQAAELLYGGGRSVHRNALALM